MPTFRQYIQRILNKISIKKSLLMIFTTIFFVPVITISIIFVCYLYNTIISWELDKMQKSLVQTEQNFDNVLFEIRNFSDRIYINKQLQNVILTDYNNIQDVYSDYSKLSFLDDYLHSNEMIENFRIYTENQNLLDNSFIMKSTNFIKASKWYENAVLFKGQPLWGYNKDVFTKKDYLCLYRSIWGMDRGEFIGVLVINLKPSVIQKIIQNQGFETAIFFDNKLLYTSKKLSNSDDQKLINIINTKETSSKKLISVDIEGINNGVLFTEFNPKNSVSLKFNIMYMIPQSQLYEATLYIVIITILFLSIMIILSLFVIFFFSRYIDSRVVKVQMGISNIVTKNFEISSSIGGNDEFEEIYKALYTMSCDVKTLINQVYVQNIEKEKLLSKQNEIRLKILTTQMNPHFLFNTLETIRMKSLASGDKEVSTMLKLLASLLRYNLTSKGKLVPLTEEINAIQNYLNIQHIRFGDRVTYDVITMCEIKDCKILPFILQPLVENSFSHGLEDKIKDGFIYILINEENDKLIITVKDNGNGMSDERKNEIMIKMNSENTEDTSSSIGLANVNSRLKLFYGEEYGLQINSKENVGTDIIITIPLWKE
jgi:two-component system, sensor histidine kinase YesM